MPSTAELMQPAAAAPPFWRITFAGFAALLVGVGLARFAYTPLIPALISAGWFAPGEVAYLGAANLAGYLAGALLGRGAASRFGAVPTLRAMMLLAAATFFACAVPLSFWWFFLWRLCSGLAGGVLMVLAAPLVLPHVPAARRGFAGGIVFTGVGIGLAGSGTLVAWLVQFGLAQTWCGLGALALLLTALAWRAWPPREAAGPPASPRLSSASAAPALRAVYVAYGLNALGLVPHMVFLVDFIARGLDRGLPVGAAYWVLFGIGALCGPVLAGRLADRTGFPAAMSAVLLVQALCVGALAVDAHPLTLAVSTFVIGACTPGTSLIALGRTQELVPQDAVSRAGAWSIATVAWALMQAAGAYLFSFIYAEFGGYAPLFALGAGALALAFAVHVVAARAAPAR